MDKQIEYSCELSQDKDFEIIYRILAQDWAGNKIKSRPYKLVEVSEVKILDICTCLAEELFNKRIALKIKRLKR